MIETISKINACDDTDIVIDIKATTDTRKSSFFSKLHNKQVYSLNESDHPILIEIIEESLQDVQEKTSTKLTLPTSEPTYTITIGVITGSSDSTTTYIEPLTPTRDTAVFTDNLTTRRPTTNYTTGANEIVNELLTTRLFASPELNDLSIYPTPNENRLTVITSTVTESMEKLTTLLNKIQHTPSCEDVDSDLRLTQHSSFDSQREEFLRRTTETSRLQWVVESLVESYIPVSRVADAANTDLQYTGMFLQLMSEIGILSEQEVNGECTYKLSNEYVTWKEDTEMNPQSTKREFIAHKNTPEELLDLSKQIETSTTLRV